MKLYVLIDDYLFDFALLEREFNYFSPTDSRQHHHINFVIFSFLVEFKWLACYVM